MVNRSKVQTFSDVFSDQKVALLIDCDNVEPDVIQQVLDEAAKYGIATIRRAYGDWSKNNMKAWQNKLQELALSPIQQFRQKNKKSTDIALVIDAMDILHEGRVNGFCLYFGDSDYIRLVERIREHGLFAIGFSRKKSTAIGLVQACDRFVYTDNLMRQDLVDDKKRKTRSQEENRSQQDSVNSEEAIALIIRALANVPGESEWVSLSELGNSLRAIDPSFDSRTYGYAKLSTLLRSFGSEFKTEKMERNIFIAR